MLLVIFLNGLFAVALAVLNFVFGRLFRRSDETQGRFYLFVGSGWLINAGYLAYLLVQTSSSTVPDSANQLIIRTLNTLTYLAFIVGIKWQLSPILKSWVVKPVVVFIFVLALLMPVVGYFKPSLMIILNIYPVLMGFIAIAGIGFNFQSHLENVNYRLSVASRIALIGSMYCYALLQLGVFFSRPYFDIVHPSVFFVCGGVMKATHMLGVISYGEAVMVEYLKDSDGERYRSGALTHAKTTKRMVSVLKHELNTEVLQLRMQFARVIQAVPPEIEGGLQQVKLRVEMIMSIVEGFLLWYRQTDVDVGIKPTVFHANSVCDAAVLGVKGFHRDKDKFNRKYAPNTRIRGVDSELYQAIRNVIKNAVEAVGERYHDTRDPGIIIIETNVEYGINGPVSVHISIEDNGGGIDPASMGRIFDDGFSTKNQDGRGHGLAIARQFIEKYRGTIIAENVIGSGARFVMTFPHAEFEKEYKVNG